MLRGHSARNVPTMISCWQPPIFLKKASGGRKVWQSAWLVQFNKLTEKYFLCIQIVVASFSKYFDT
jgi:hypothetical protein